MSKIFLVLFLTLLSQNAKGFEVQTTSYGASHMRIVESGFENFKAQFLKSNDSEKSSLLFCLERYVDPYYQTSIDYDSKLYDWLFKLLGSEEAVRVKEHAFDVLVWDSTRDMSMCEINERGKLSCSDEE